MSYSPENLLSEMCVYINMHAPIQYLEHSAFLTAPKKIKLHTWCLSILQKHFEIINVCNLLCILTIYKLLNI